MILGKFVNIFIFSFEIDQKMMAFPNIMPTAEDKLELFYWRPEMDNQTLLHTYLTLPGVSGKWAQWCTLHYLGEGLETGPRIQAIQNSDGRTQIFAYGIDSSVIRTNFQKSATGGDTRDDWLELNLSTSTSKGFTVCRNYHGLLEIFVTANNGQIYHRWQQSPGSSPWSEWRSLGCPASSPTTGIKVTGNLNGTLELFVQRANGEIYTKTQLSPMGAWSEWKSLGCPPANPKQQYNCIVVEAGHDYENNLGIFVECANGEIYTKTQLSPMGAWSEWMSLGCPTGFTLHGSPAICRNIDGTLEIFRISSDNSFKGQLFHTFQLRPGLVNGWRSLGEPLGIRADTESPLLVTPSVVRNNTGALEVFVSGLCELRPRISHKWQLSPMEEWSEWSEINLTAINH
jgi:hypothetical protein